MFFLLPSFGNLLVYLLLSFVLVLILFILPKLLGPKTNYSYEKMSAYECGFEPFMEEKEVFESHFIIVAILFILFDLELLFIFPWAVSVTQTGYGGFLVMFIFLILLTGGLVYEWVCGALVWPIFFVSKKSPSSYFSK